MCGFWCPYTGTFACSSQLTLGFSVGGTTGVMVTVTIWRVQRAAGSQLPGLLPLGVAGLCNLPDLILPKTQKLYKSNKIHFQASLGEPLFWCLGIQLR